MGWLLEPELPLRVAYLRITELTSFLSSFPDDEKAR